MKVKQKLFLSFLVVGVFILLFGFFSIYRAQETLKSSIGQSAMVLTTDVMNEIDENIHDRIEEIRIYIRDVELQGDIAVANQEFEELDNKDHYIVEQDERWISQPKDVSTPFMQQFISNNLATGLIEKIDYYLEQYGHLVYSEIFITNKYGTNIAMTRRTSDYFQADEEWWQVASKGDLYVGDVIYDESSGVYGVVIALGIFDKDSNFLGAIKALLSLEEVTNLIESIIQATHKYEKHKSLNFILIDKDGKIIYSTKEFELFETRAKALELEYGNKNSSKHHSYFIGLDPADNIKKLFTHVHSDGYKEYKGLGWVLIAEYLLKDVFAPAAVLKKDLFLATLVLCFVAFLMALFIARRISMPLVQLSSVANKISDGDFNVKVDIKYKDEFGFLGSVFNKMVKNLRSKTTSIDNLNKEVSERKIIEDRLFLSNIELNERIKELNCLYTISDVVEDYGNSVVNIYENAAKVIANGMKYVGYACARITVNGNEYKTDNFKESEWKLSENMIVFKEVAGTIDVFYLKEFSELDEGPFLKEERSLLDAIAERLGRATERKIYERDIKKSEDKYKSLFEDSMDAIMMLSLKSGFLDCNSATCDLFGISNKEDLLKSHPADFSPQHQPDGRLSKELSEEKMNIALEKGSNFFEWLHKKKSGEEFYASVLLTRIELEGKDVLQATVRDITEQKNIDRIIEESEEKFRTLVANIPGVVYRCNNDEDWIMSYISNGIFDLSGYPINDFINNEVRSFSSVIYPDDRGEVDSFIQKAIARREPYVIEYRIIHKNGYIKWVYEKGQGVFDKDDKLLWLDGAIFDITERKETERIKDDFLNTVSHELRTPLSIAKEGISLVLDQIPGKINKEQDDILQTAKDSINRLAKIINDLLDTSKIEARKIELEREDIEAQVLLDMISKMFKSSAGERGINLKFKSYQENTKLYVDKDKVIQVFTNLVGNALKFTEKGKIEVAIHDIGRDIECSVSDTGRGISKEDLPKVFDKFQQFGRAPGPGIKGTGLGLTVSKGIIEMHGGRIWVESELGKGTKFIFILPKTTV